MGSVAASSELAGAVITICGRARSFSAVLAVWKFLSTWDVSQKL